MVPSLRLHLAANKQWKQLQETTKLWLKTIKYKNEGNYSAMNSWPGFSTLGNIFGINTLTWPPEVLDEHLNTFDKDTNKSVPRCKINRHIYTHTSTCHLYVNTITDILQFSAMWWPVLQSGFILFTIMPWGQSWIHPHHINSSMLNK